MFPLRLSFPTTCNEDALEAQLTDNKMMSAMPIVEGVRANDRAILCTIYAAVHVLIRTPVMTSPSDATPWKDNSYTALHSPRVFLHQGTTVRKVFDMNCSDIQPN